MLFSPNCEVNTYISTHRNLASVLSDGSPEKASNLKIAPIRMKRGLIKHKRGYSSPGLCSCRKIKSSQSECSICQFNPISSADVLHNVIKEEINMSV